jgi:prevent-host-death family protein
MTITIINTTAAKEQFADIINRVTHTKERVILTRRGKEIAAIIPLEDLILLQESEDRHDLREAIEALKEARHAGTTTLEQLKAEAGA